MRPIYAHIWECVFFSIFGFVMGVVWTEDHPRCKASDLISPHSRHVNEVDKETEYPAKPLE
jgi:hypothetical protein